MPQTGWPHGLAICRLTIGYVLKWKESMSSVRRNLCPWNNQSKEFYFSYQISQINSFGTLITSTFSKNCWDDKAGVCGLANRRIQNMMICIFKCLHFGKYPCYLKQLIKLRSTAYSLRGTNILSLPKPSTTTYGLNSFSYSSVKYWNSLPDHFRKTVDYSEFKRKLLVHGFS